MGCWLGIQPYLWTGDFSSSWGRPLHSVLGLPHIMVAGFQEKWCWWNKIEMHAFLWASRRNHIASLLLFFIAQGSHRGVGFKGKVIDFTTQWGRVSSHTERRCWIWDVVIANFANMTGYTPPDLSVPTNTASFLGSQPICTISKMVPSSSAFSLGSSHQEIWGSENSEYGVIIHQNLSLQGCFEGLYWWLKIS